MYEYLYVIQIVSQHCYYLQLASGDCRRRQRLQLPGAGAPHQLVPGQVHGHQPAALHRLQLQGGRSQLGGQVQGQQEVLPHSHAARK